jgi:hypothetical protein
MKVGSTEVKIPADSVPTKFRGHPTTFLSPLTGLFYKQNVTELKQFLQNPFETG